MTTATPKAGTTDQIRQVSASRRYRIPDILRGITLLSMTGYHLMWDLVYLYGVRALLHRLYLAAEHLLELYPAFGILLGVGETATAERYLCFLMRCAGDDCNGHFHAGATGGFRRFDFPRRGDAADDSD